MKHNRKVRSLVLFIQLIISIESTTKIKAFWRTSENTVRVWIYSAIISYCLVAIVGKDLKINRSTNEILQISCISLLNKTPVNEIFTKRDYEEVNELNANQLTIRWFQQDNSEPNH